MKVLIILCIVAGALAINCPVNQHYDSCGTACPLTCDNYQDPPKACVLMCNPGCHCDEGYVKTSDGRCVLPERCESEANACGANERYTDCGTSCPLTCDNYQNPPKICNLMCNIGCECKEGYVRSADGRCVLPENCPAQSDVEKSCTEEPDEGMCRGYFPMYYYDKESGVCEEFVYGGCQGNGNRYETEEECMSNCHAFSSKKSSNALCELPAETGLCRGYFPRYHFDKASGQCKKFIYGGCGGNENNFKSEEDCKDACGSKGVCGANERYSECGTACPLTCDNYQNPPKFCNLMCVIGCECEQGYVRSADGRCVLPESCPAHALNRPDCDKAPETGLCKAYFRRFYYDQEAGMCKTFVYGGCGGNRNNFATEDECYNRCGALAPVNAVCEQEKEVGPCRAAFRRYFYNKETGQCEKFIYGGCSGNDNNFASKSECESTCLA